MEQGTNRLWGVFHDPKLLYSMYENLEGLLNKTLCIRMMRMNTNTILYEWKGSEAIHKKFGPEREEPKHQEEVIPKELRLEWSRLKTRLSEFKTNYDLFRKMVSEGVLSTTADVEDIPFVFRDKYTIFCDIYRMDIPEDEAFGYFLDRFYYVPSCTFESV